VAHHGEEKNPSKASIKLREWLNRVKMKTLFIESGSPWENGYIESFNGKLRDELLNLENFDSLLEAKVLIESWSRNYNTIRPHSSLGYVRHEKVEVSSRAVCHDILANSARVLDAQDA